MHNFADGLRNLGLEVELLYLGKLNSPLSLMRAKKTITKASESFDITHMQFGSACGLAGVSANGVRILSLRGSDWHQYFGRNYKMSIHSLLACNFSRISLRSYQGVIVMSNRMYKEVSRIYPKRKIAVIPDPIDTNRFQPNLGNISKSPIRILFTTLSKENPIKRLRLAQMAVRIASVKMREDIELSVATGLSHDQMPNFITGCRLVLCTSTHEGWPNSVKEALSCGIPFVSTDVSDLRDISSRNSACVVCAADPERIADGIVSCLQRPLNIKLRNEALKMSYEVTCENLMKFYESSLSV